MKIMAFDSIGLIFGKNVWTILGHKNSKPSHHTTKAKQCIFLSWDCIIFLSWVEGGKKFACVYLSKFYHPSTRRVVMLKNMLPYIFFDILVKSVLVIPFDKKRLILQPFIRNQNDIFKDLWYTVSHTSFSHFYAKSRKQTEQKLKNKQKTLCLLRMKTYH